MRNLISRLEKKDWKKRDIIKAVSLINSAKQNKGLDIIFLDKRIYWILLAVIITANFAISIALLPILIALRGFILYVIIITLGIAFGLLFELVIRSIEHLEKKHHFALAILIPLIALANIFIITNMSNDLMTTLSLKNFHEPIVIAFAYAISFVLPYIAYRFVLKIEYYSKG